MRCYYCKSEQLKLLVTQKGIRFNCFGHNKKIYKCNDCGLIQLLPQWTDEEIDDLYKDCWSKNDFIGQKKKIKISKYLLKYLRKDDTILEIGSGLGDNIKFLSDKGFAGIGIDKNKDVCDDWFVFNNDFWELDNCNKKDFIFAIHLFEHLKDPIKFINKIFKMLNKNGRCILEVPNVDDPLLTLYDIPEFEKFYWFPYHLYFFNYQTLSNLLFQFTVSFDIKILLKQEYGILNHLYWLTFGKPNNMNFKIPIIDWLYELFLTKVLKTSDTLVVVMEKKI